MLATPLVIIFIALLILTVKWWLDRRVQQHIQQQYPQQWPQLKAYRGGIVAAIRNAMEAGELDAQQDRVLSRYRQQVSQLKGTIVVLLLATVALGFFLK